MALSSGLASIDRRAAAQPPVRGRSQRFSSALAIPFERGGLTDGTTPGLLATHHPISTQHVCFFADEMSCIEESLTTRPDAIEALDNVAHAAYFKSWHRPFISMAADIVTRAGLSGGCKRAQIAERVQIERTAFSDLHHHGEGSASNIVRLLASPELATAAFDYSGWSFRNLMGRNGFISALSAVAEYHGVSNAERSSFGWPEYEILSTILRELSSDQLKRPLSNLEAASAIRDSCAAGGRDLLVPWQSKIDRKAMRHRIRTWLNSVTPATELGHLRDIWLRPLIHTYYIVEGAGFPNAWTSEAGDQPVVQSTPSVQ